MQKRTAIYALCDMPTANFFYVGGSQHPPLRLGAHLYSIDKPAEIRKSMRINEISRNGNKIAMYIIEWVDHEYRHVAEAWWTGELYRRGYALTNRDRDIKKGLSESVLREYRPKVDFLSLHKHHCILSQDNFKLKGEDAREELEKMREKERENQIKKLEYGISLLDIQGLKDLSVIILGMIVDKSAESARIDMKSRYKMRDRGDL